MDEHTLKLVFSYIQVPEDYVAITRTCKYWHAVIETVYPGGVPLVNQLIALHKMYPNAYWNYQAISGNPNLTFNFANSIKHKLSIPNVSCNMSITADDIISNPDFGWDIHGIKLRHKLDVRLIRTYNLDPKTAMSSIQVTIEDIINNPEWDYNSDHSGDPLYAYTTLKNIIKYPHMPWNLDVYAENLGVSRELLDYYITSKFTDYDMYLDMCVKDIRHVHLGYPGIPLEVIEQYLNKYPKRRRISIQKGSLITWEFIKKHPRVEFCGYYLPEIVYTSPHFAGNTDKDTIMEYILKRITWDGFIYNNAQHGFDFHYLSSVVIWCGFNFILKHAEHLNSNCWRSVMRRKDITWDTIIKYKLYEKTNPSSNPNITWQIVRDYPWINWDFLVLSLNAFGKTC